MATNPLAEWAADNGVAYEPSELAWALYRALYKTQRLVLEYENELREVKNAPKHP